MKKTLVILIIFASFAMKSFGFQSGDLLYTIISTDPPCVRLDGHIDGQAAQGELIIPETVTNEGVAYTVTRIANSAFFSCTRLSGELVIPDAVTIIGSKAFYHCYGITSVTFGNALEEIREHAFYQCGLQQISAFPESLTEIGEEAFCSCLSLTGTIVIPSQMTTIKESAFSNCGITSVIFPEGLTTIEQYAFIDTPLTSLHIPSSLTSIGTYAFVDTKLESITVDEANPVYDSRNNCNALIETATNTLITGCFNTVIPHSIVAIGNGAFINCDRLRSITIPEGVTMIEDKAFWDCDSLATVVLPTSLNSIGKTAFLCYGMTSIVSKSYTPPTAVYDSYDFFNNSFGGMNHNIPIHIPFGTTEAYQNASGWNIFSNFIETEMNLEGEWYFEIINDDGTITYQHLQYSNDTVINDKEKVKVIVRTNHIYDKDDQTETTHEYVYEENNKVYWWNKDLQEFTTLYDLSAEEGDEWEITVEMESITVHVDSVLVVHEQEGRIYKKLSISDTGHVFDGDIVVGLGHLTSFFPEKLMRHSSDFEVNGLRCYWVDEALVYQNGNEDCDAVYNMIHLETKEVGTDAFVVYPNPSDGFIVVGMLGQYRIANLMGQTLLQGVVNAENQQIDISALPSGLYFLSVGGQTVKLMKR